MPYGKHQFVQRLRIYPHAMREANAYYSSAKKALLFGYFPAEGEDVGDNYPGETVFSCLSHDIIAHETTHALLDGLHPRFVEPSNVDALAFHEAICRYRGVVPAFYLSRDITAPDCPYPRRFTA